MAKFFGKIGYAVSKDVRPGVWDGEITEREYFGDLIRNTSRYQTSDKLNDDINISNIRQSFWISMSMETSGI